MLDQPDSSHRASAIVSLSVLVSVTRRGPVSLEPADERLKELVGPPRQGVDRLRGAGTRQERGRDVLAAERQGPAGEGHGVQQFVVVNLAEAGAAVLEKG